MRQLRADVLSNQEVMPGINLMWLRAPDIAQEAQPGQFLMVRCGDGFDPLLRRALSIHRLGTSAPGGAAQGCALLYGLQGAGTSLLGRMRPGDALDVLGPLGRGYTVHRASRNLLLIAEGWGISPLVALAESQVARGRSVTLLAGAPEAGHVYPQDLLAAEIELVAATVDGSLGHQGAVVDLVGDYWSWADEVYACGPWSMYQELARATSGQWPRKPVQVLAEMSMACGVGACFACTIETRRGPRLSCREGPRLLLSDLLL
ncbi:MAG: dihydroorotate dehydrogenase electron transfer subunit [Chloroflexi bacterium]|nr:dihydroorotate dehydrogenase electron transfer subunit [Chloroflexota bacterium]